MMRHAAAVAVAVLLSPALLVAQTATFTVTTESANIHKGPSTGAVVIGHAPRGTVLAVTRELGSWVKVSWPGAEDGVGYVHVSWGSIGPGAVTESNRTVRMTSTQTATPAPASATAAGPAERPRAAEPPAVVRPVYITPASHRLGLGARMGGSPVGFGVTARAWRRDRIGIQLDASRHALASTATPARATSFQVEPSLLYSLPDRVTDYMWLRPYVGSGATVRRYSFGSGTDTAGESASGHGFGLQAFGGGELTFAGAPQFALSADLGYHWFPTPLAGFDAGGLALSLSGHWYVK